MARNNGQTYQWSDGTVRSEPEPRGGGTKPAPSGNDAAYKQRRENERAAFESCVGLCSASRRNNLTGGSWANGEQLEEFHPQRKQEQKKTPAEVPQGYPVEMPVPVGTGNLFSKLFGSKKGN